MRRKIGIAWICVFLVAVIIFVIFPVYDTFFNDYNKNSFQGMNLEQKYHTACGQCTSYISKKDWGSAVSVSVKDVQYGDIKEHIELMQGEYADEAVLWEFAFVISEDFGERELFMYCDPESNALCAVVYPRYEKSTEYQFSYEVERTDYRRGESLVIEVTLTNISGQDYAYTGAYGDYYPVAELYYKDADGKQVVQCSPETYSSDTKKDETGDYVIKNNEGRTRSYYYVIPEHAPLGEYDIEISYNGKAVIIEAVIMVTE